MPEAEDLKRRVKELEAQVDLLDQVAKLSARLGGGDADGTELVDKLTLGAGVSEQLSPRTRSLVRKQVFDILWKTLTVTLLLLGLAGYSTLSGARADLAQGKEEFELQVEEAKGNLTKIEARYTEALDGMKARYVELEKDIDDRIAEAITNVDRVGADIRNQHALQSERVRLQVQEGIYSATAPVVESRVQAETLRVRVGDLLEKTKSDVAWVTSSVTHLRSKLEQADKLTELFKSTADVTPEQIAETIAAQIESDPALRLPGSAPRYTVVALLQGWTSESERREWERREGWYLCDGVSRDGYEIPDLRGFFLRGLDTSDRVEEVAGRELGSPQEDQTPRHNHAVFTGQHLPKQGGGTQTTVKNVVSEGEDFREEHAGGFWGEGKETRPVNVAVHWVIYMGKP